MAYKTNFKNTIWAGGAGAFLHADVQEGIVGSSQSTQPGKLVVDDAELKNPTSFTKNKALKVVLERTSNTGGTLEDVFTEGELIEVAFPRSGELFNLLMGPSNSVSVGNLVTANTANEEGYISIYTGSEEDILSTNLFEALEAVSASTSAQLVLCKKL